MGAVKTQRGAMRDISPCQCGAARVSVMVPRASFEWDAKRPSDAWLAKNLGRMAHQPEMRLMDASLDMVVCVRCDAFAADDIDIRDVDEKRRDWLTEGEH